MTRRIPGWAPVAVFGATCLVALSFFVGGLIARSSIQERETAVDEARAALVKFIMTCKNDNALRAAHAGNMESAVRAYSVDPGMNPAMRRLLDEHDRLTRDYNEARDRYYWLPFCSAFHERPTLSPAR